MNSVTILVLVGLILMVGTMGLAAEAAGPAPKASDAEPDDVEAVVQGNTAFALDLYHQVRGQDPGNLFFSPFSLSSALAMTYAGARGPTAAEMAQVLHVPPDPNRLHPAFAALVHQIIQSHEDENKSKGYQLHVANALWGQQDYGFLDDFLKTLATYYSAGLREVDFETAAEQARRTINAWVEQQTRDKIQDLITQGVLDSQTRLVLTNAIYFKGDWASPFETKLTKDEPFHVTADRTVSVPMMNQTDKFRYLDGGTFQALELPYAGDDLAMVVFLPKQVDGLAEFEASLTPERLTEWLSNLRRREVRVALPRFQTTAQFELSRTLSAMGMHSAFTGSADFSGMNGRRDLAITAVLHKAFVDVNEEGTEAAAATGIVVGLTAAIQTPPVFRADHPFLFLIRDNRSGSILFLGRLVNPKE